MTTASAMTNGGRRFNRAPVAEWAWFALLLAVLSLHLWFPRLDATPLNDTWSVDAGGRNALYQLAARRLPSVRRNLEPLYRAAERLSPNATLCLLGPARSPTPREWAALDRWVERGGRLLIAARREDPEIENPSGALKVVRETPAGELQTDLLDSPRIRWKSKGAIKAQGASDLIRVGESVQAARLAQGAGSLTLVATDHLFSNVALFERDSDNGALALSLISGPDETREVVFDESLNATGAPRIVGVLLSPEIRPLTVQLLAIVVVFAWRGSRRFGGLLPREGALRRNLPDHTDAVGNIYWKTHSGKAALQAYFDQLRQQLRLRSGRDRQRSELAAVSQRSGLPVDEIERLLAQAEAALEAPQLRRRPAAAMIRRLARLRAAKRS
ncbi:MAG: DUF4350 domain-containing protein [Planctomycetaceae bacterium]